MSIRKRARSASHAAGATLLLLGASTLPAAAQAPANAPLYLLPSLLSILQAPLPLSVVQPSIGAVIPELSIASDSTGQIATYQPGTATFTSSNAFFQSLGTNGRTCATCHSPESAMSVSLSAINQRYITSGGHDPLFAPVDGATCPKNVPANLIAGLLGILFQTPTAHPYAALLNKGLFRIPLPVPTNAEFTLSVVSDPYGCNTTSQYNQVTLPNGTRQQIVSVYRRPLMAANLKFKVNSAANSGLLPPIDLLDGSPLPNYTAPAGAPFGPGGNGAAETGTIENGNIMSDGREPTLTSQAIDATLTHAQAKQAPTTAQLQQILAFEDGIYAAQYSDLLAGSLSSNGGTGGPQTLSADPTGTIALVAGTPVMTLYTGWKPVNSLDNQRRDSIYRGEQIFNNRAFNASNVAGFNNALGITNPAVVTCSVCHGQLNVGSDPTARAQHDIGIGGDLVAFGGPAPATDLPIFKLTCKGTATTAYNGRVVVTNDPGVALISGKCADIGRFTVAPLRGLAARAPYFTDGSSPTVGSVVDFYNKRFGIGLSTADEQDLVNFLNSL